jgi:hypothetical protein
LETRSEVRVFRVPGHVQVLKETKDIRRQG